MIERSMRLLLTLGCFLAIASLMSLGFVSAGSAERVVATATLALGVALVAVSAIIIRRGLPRIDASTPPSSTTGMEPPTDPDLINHVNPHENKEKTGSPVRQRSHCD